MFKFLGTIEDVVYALVLPLSLAKVHNVFQVDLVIAKIHPLSVACVGP